MDKLEKVIKGLECCQKKVCIYDDTLKECPYWELCGNHEEAFEDCTKALAIDALALLKAQEPMLVKQTNGHTGSPIWICGNCKSWIGSKIVSYCWHCGRAVKWE